MKIDFPNIDVDSGPLYDAGAYRVRVKSIENVVAKSSGNEQLRVKTEILDDKYKGKQLTDHITLIASCEWKLVKFVATLGLDPKKLGSMDTNSGDFRQLLNKLIGKTAVWIVDQQTGSNGALRNTVTDYQADPNKDEAKGEPEFLDGEPVVWDD